MDVTDGYVLGARYSWTANLATLTDGQTRGICLSVADKAIRCVTSEGELLHSQFSYKSWYGDLSTAAAPADGTNIDSTYTQISTVPTAEATEGYFACDTNKDNVTELATSTCFLQQETWKQDNTANYRFDKESPSDGTITFYRVADNVLEGATTVSSSDWSGAVTNVAAGFAAATLALLSF